MRYNTIREAAVAGLAIAIPKSFKEKVEYGGIVRKDKTGYYFDGIRTDNQPSGVNPIGLVSIGEARRDDSIAAIFHTHVLVRNSETETFSTDFFSAQDIITSWMAEKPHYLGDTETGSVYELTDTDEAFFQMAIVGTHVEYKGQLFPAFKGLEVATVAKEAA